MDILQRIRSQAAAKLQHIVLPEGEDERTIVAAARTGKPERFFEHPHTNVGRFFVAS